MKMKKLILATVIMTAPILAFAADNNMGAGMPAPATDVQAASDKSAMPDCPMMGRGYRQGMMGRGMGMQEDDGMMEMMERQRMMEDRMDMMEMMMERNMGMQGCRGGSMMGRPCGRTPGMMGPGMMGPGMQGRGMGMQGGPMMYNRMGDMEGMSVEQRQQMMQHRMDMMQQRMQQMPDQNINMQNMNPGNQDPGQ